jgi:tetratricopeptide (TPR) repeat protein
VKVKVEKKKGSGFRVQVKKKAITIARQALGFFLTAFILIGCALLPRGDWPPGMEGIPPRSEIASVPFYPQDEYQCGPAALAMALAWSGLDVQPAQLTEKVYTASLQGSLQPAMIAGARRSGRLAYVISGTDALIREAAAGHPVIVLQNLGLSWVPRWHYAVVVGYDIPADAIVLHTGTQARERTAMGVFQNTWARSENWGLLVLPPGDLPVTAKEVDMVAAALGLEKARQPAAAAKSYQAALSRWPQNLPAMIGLGNSYYALGDLKNSELAFLSATEAHPENGAAFNNLAHVLLALGRREEALAAAQRAVALGGAQQNLFRKTLEEIESRSP